MLLHCRILTLCFSIKQAASATLLSARAAIGGVDMASLTVLPDFSRSFLDSTPMSVQSLSLLTTGTPVTCKDFMELRLTVKHSQSAQKEFKVASFPRSGILPFAA